MYSAFLLACLISFLGASIEDSVIELTDETFNQEIAKHELMLVEFFAPWCRHCKRLAPEYSEAAERLQSSTPPIPLAKVDCIESGKEVCKEQDLDGYPTLKVFRNGKFVAEYDGSKDADEIVEYMEKQAAPSSLFLSSEEKLQQFLDHTEPSIVGFFKYDSDSLIRDSFVKCANELRDKFRFAHTFETTSELGQDKILSESSEGEQVWLYQPIKLRTKLDTPAVRIPESDPETMQTFIETNFMGLVGIRDPSNRHYFDTEDRDPQFVLYSAIDWERNYKMFVYWRNRILKLDKQYKSKMYFAMSDLTTSAREISHKYGLDSRTEQMQAIITNKGQKYLMHQEAGGNMSTELLAQFIGDFFEGKLEPFLKSEPIPTEDNGPVKTVVGSTFEEIVMEQKKDVMIEFYAPWCGHCKSLAPKYKQLATKLENNTDIVIAKLDATANDYPGLFKLKGFPTIFWVSAGDKANPIEYTGGREVEDLLSYIEKQATIPFNTSDLKSKEEL